MARRHRIRANTGNVDQLPDARFSGEPRELVRLLLHGRNGSLLAALHIETHGVHDALNSRHGSGNGAIIIDIGMDLSMPSPTSGKRASVRSGCRDATCIENSHSSKCWTTWRPRKPVPPNTVTFPRAIVPFPGRCRRAVPPQAPKVGSNSRRTAGYSLCQTTSLTNRNRACFETWKTGKFAPVPGETEFIPLPETKLNPGNWEIRF